MTQNTSWQHKGHSIELLSSGKFRTVIGGISQLAPSVDALKKRIDKHLESVKSFTPFKALNVPHFHRLSANPEARPAKVGPEFTVVERKITKARSRYGVPAAVFVTDQRDYGSQLKEEFVVAPSTPEAKAAINAFNALYVKSQRELARLETELQKAREAIPRIVAEKYGKAEGEE